MLNTALRTRNGAFVLLRRMRWPLGVLIVSYAIAILGMTLMPGQTPDGQPWKMSFFHAFYFVSFLGNTIGLGEIPYPFTDAQRLWASFSIYLTVFAWLYSAGSLLTLLQDPLFRRLWHEHAVERRVRRLREPFYLLCGYDDAGRRVTRELTEDGLQVVVVDSSAEAVDAVDVDDHRLSVPALLGDATDPQVLLVAGLRHPQCQGVLALTGRDELNARVALNARLLAPQLPVLCAARDHAWHPRLLAAGASALINPYDRFADRLRIALNSPSLHVIYEALTAQRGGVTGTPPQLPRGRWLLCGWGRFARAVKHRLEQEGIEVVVIAPERDPGLDAHEFVQGDPADPGLLKRAGAEHAQALVAATGEDIDNLGIVMAARQLNPKLFVVARQTQRRHTPVFRAARIDLLMGTGYMIATEMLRHTRAPLLDQFLRRAGQQDEDWSARLLAQLRAEVGEEVLESWSLRLVPTDLPAACEALIRGEGLSLRRLLTRVDGAGGSIHAVPLMLERGGRAELLPALDSPLLQGDRLLICGSQLARSRMRALASTGDLAPLLSS